MVPDSLTREEGSVDEVVNHPRQTIPHGFTRTTYYDENPFYFGAPTPQFQLLLLIRHQLGNLCHRVSSLAIAETRRPGCTTSFCRT